MSPDATSPSLARLVAAGVLDAELGGLGALLLDLGVPLLVAGSPGSGRRELLDALIAALPAGRQPDPAASIAERRLVLVAGILSAATPPGLLRAALTATGSRSGLAATIEAADLAGVLEVLRSQGLTDDEISFLGVVLVLGSDGGAGSSGRPAARVVAGHYLRPVARDAGGHVQRLGPAVLATWDAARSRYDHFAWGIYPELAARTGRRAGDLEHEHREWAGSLGARPGPGPV
ncbi:MAG: hypothetical protein P4L30_08305 [Candidatus Limnocylindrales bacterium]|nr:hypothetical protein [Candidatus Limnocylindrales bacterium]